jgi:predicted Zn-dependent protease
MWNVNRQKLRVMGPQKVLPFLVISGLIFSFLFGSFTKRSLAMTADEEKKLGKKILLEVEKQVEWVRDPTIQVFVDRIGYSIVREVGPTPFEFKFYVIKAQDPNAFAIPGGTIFVTTGLIVLGENEQEIAGVLGHEISHVTGRHVDQMIEKSKRLNIASLAAILLGALAGRGGAATEAIAATAMATSEALALKYSRENETDADQNGLYRMIKAGYDPNGMITFLNKIHRMSLSMAPKIPVYLLTHPAIESRIALLENLMQIGQKPVGPFRKVGNFKRVQLKAFVEEREPDAAVNHFGSMVKTNPQDVDEIYGLGLAFKKMGRLDKSTEVFQSGLSLSPKDPDLLRELGIVYFLSGKVDQAMENLEAARSVSVPDQDADLSTLYYLGRTYQEKEDFANALPLFLKIQKEMPEFPDVYNNLGSVYGRMSQKGRSHFYFGKHFKLIGDKKSALLHFRAADQWLEKESSEKEEVRREIKELTETK